MSETTVIEGRKVSVSFSRKVSFGNYETADVWVHVEDTVQAGTSDADMSQRAVDMLNAAKAAAFDTLGLESFVDDSGVLREKHEPKPNVTATANAIGTQFAGSTHIKVMNPGDLDPGESIPANIVAKCDELGITAVWANKGQYGRFWKEAVARGETPKVPDSRDPSKGGIIKA